MSINIPTVFKFNTRVNIHFGKLQEIVDWCNSNCKHDWGYVEDSDIPLGIPDTFWDFYFESERDYFAFLLWIN